ncbi:GntR family transcriptional regulator [Lysinibacillus yapensis]|uniref:GntR family transcriptional regulator n=1 Tax=Ureibacillus yapensis TaxID=2304605 RepID=A0A396S6F7_9BACL|nr:GntR family transcriptional regulator [Lysinibacillus yapensis]RHW35901.1 GntR family transcriptional regulator [Lysinibacillus yapensis]
MSIDNLKDIKRKTLSTIVYEDLKTAIINGEIEPGTQLKENEIGQQLNVSATPVREAFRRLASEGLIKIIPWRGAIVQSFNEKEMEDVYACRESLEVLVIQLAIDNIDEVGLQQLEELVDQSLETIDATEFYEINTSIHNVLLKYANNQMLEKLLSQISEIVLHDRNFSSYSLIRKQEIYQEHKDIIEAVAEKDVAKAESAIRTHIRNGFNYIKSYKKIEGNSN